MRSHASQQVAPAFAPSSTFAPFPTFTALTTLTAFATCLMGQAQAQVNAEQELKICQSFCTASKSQCERNRGVSGVATLVGAFAMDYIRPAELTSGKRNNSPESMTEAPKLSTPGTSDPWILAKQPCEAERLACAKDCAAESKPKTPE